jgi:hypothetical protein
MQTLKLCKKTLKHMDDTSIAYLIAQRKAKKLKGFMEV